MKQVLVTGANGQLGSELKKLSKKTLNINFIFIERNDMPLEDSSVITRFLNKIKPDLIINAAAYTAVDKAEVEKELSEQVNHYSVETISKWCSKNKAKLIHISTDYVFDGKSNTPYKENEMTSPINWYGETKLRNEKAIIKNNADAIIIRTSWVYSEYGNNFVKTMLNLMNIRDEINVIDDQIGTPTYALDLAKVIINIIEYKNWIPGMFHYSNEGRISWYDFAVKIAELKKLNCKINPISSHQFPTIAARPNYSLLDKNKISKTYKVTVPKWEESLKECLQLLN